MLTANQTISVGVLNGVRNMDSSSRAIIWEAMKTCTNTERLCVCLYLMSGLPDNEHSLERIEEELRAMFPPSVPHGTTPDKYTNFAATAIRQYFNFETMQVNNGKLPRTQRNWVQVGRGFWRNTEIGNDIAKSVLSERGVVVKHGESPWSTTTAKQKPSLSNLMDRYIANSSLKEESPSSTVEPNRTPVPEIAHGEQELVVATQSQTAKESDESVSDVLAAVKALLSVLEADTPDLDIASHGSELTLAGNPKLIKQILEVTDSSKFHLVEMDIRLAEGKWDVKINMTS